MAAFTKYTLAAAGQTGTATHTGVEATNRSTTGVMFNFLVEAVGGTPTVTYKIQGSLDGTNYADVMCLPSDSDTAVTTKVVTAVGAYITAVSQAHSRSFRYFRLVTSSNTNVTYSATMHTVGTVH